MRTAFTLLVVSLLMWALMVAGATALFGAYGFIISIIVFILTFIWGWKKGVELEAKRKKELLESSPFGYLIALEEAAKDWEKYEYPTETIIRKDEHTTIKRLH